VTGIHESLCQGKSTSFPGALRRARISLYGFIRVTLSETVEVNCLDSFPIQREQDPAPLGRLFRLLWCSCVLQSSDQLSGLPLNVKPRNRKPEIGAALKLICGHCAGQINVVWSVKNLYTFDTIHLNLFSIKARSC
jgi:hypothetical protein